MNSSLLIRTFSQLTPKEARDFVAFVHCTVFNRREEVCRLSQYIASIKGRPRPKAYSAEILFNAAFPGAVYDNQQLRLVMSYTLDLLREYLALQEWRSNPVEIQQALFRTLRNRNLEKLYDKALQKAETFEVQNPVRDAQHHFRQYQLHHEKLGRSAKHKRSTALNLQPLPDELTTFYTSEMLRHACSAQMHQAVAGQTHHIQLLDAILGIVEQSEMLETPAVAVYYHAYRMLQRPTDNEHFLKLKQLLVEHEIRFEQEEMRGLYLMAINGCIRRMNAGDRSYIREAFEVYKAALERDLLTENGYLSSFTYKNIIRAGVELEEHEWTERFIESYKSALHPRERENTYRYNRAFLFFIHGNYKMAMPLLLQADLEDPLNNLHARRMLVRSYFELGEYDALESILQSFNAYLNRQKNLGYHKDLNLNFVKFVQKINRLAPSDIKSRVELRAEIMQSSQLAERSWLLEKVEILRP